MDILTLAHPPKPKYIFTTHSPNKQYTVPYLMVILVSEQSNRRDSRPVTINLALTNKQDQRSRALTLVSVSQI